MKSLKDKDELFGAIQAIRNPEVRKPMTPMRRHNPFLNNQTTIKLPIDPTSDDTEFVLPLGDPDPEILSIPSHIRAESKELAPKKETIGGDSIDAMFEDSGMHFLKRTPMGD